MPSIQRLGCTPGCAPAPNSHLKFAPGSAPLPGALPACVGSDSVSRLPAASPLDAPGNPCAHGSWSKLPRVLPTPSSPVTAQLGPQRPRTSMAPCPCLGRTPSALPWGILLAPHHGHCPAWEVVGRHSHPPGMEQTKRTDLNVGFHTLPEHQNTTDPQPLASSARMEWQARSPDGSDGCRGSWGSHGPRFSPI